MKLSPRDIDKLTIFMVANSARQRRECGVKLNYIEACALISESILAGAREGRSVAECMEIGKQAVGTQDVMNGVRELLPLLQIEAAFVDGTKLVSCHDPVGA
ncbi:urease subunit gamma [Kitasatospora sp. GAS204B]|uniref:urease subunit gamma n=1 Tax=unclassified Kitasatospora TaxID=2633591 RepID=UPI00247362F2|nr:urease subunit gamma [Kitasatospora sp. GAS204B]MDH6119723.1 urease subunit gamma [Kitasatospora sp. GAS204B]